MNRSLSRLVRMSLAVVLAAAGLAMPMSSAQAGVGTVLTVNAINDPGYPFVDGCTLREAMQAAINDADYNDCHGDPHTYGNDSIVFDITGTTQITLGSTLPTIAGGTLHIDGYNSGSPVTIDGGDYFRLFAVTGGVLLLRNLRLQNGYTEDDGGAIRNEGTLWIYDSTFLDNVAGGNGGAIYNYGGSATLVNSTFVGNSAHYGGGLENNGGTALILNNTFSGNDAVTHGGALSTWGGSPGPSTTLVNTIMADGTPEDCWNGAGAFAGSVFAGGNSIIESTTFDATSCSSIAVSNSDPQLGVMTGLPGYLPLKASSPAIDTGYSTTCMSSPVNNFSQNGIPRPQDGNHDGVAVCDIGSIEAPVPVTLRSAGTRDGWILESSENASEGSTKNSSGTTFRLGDDAADRQYRAILSFSTASLPDDAEIISARLKIKQAGLTGSDPFGSLGTIRVDMRRGAFGSAVLESSDFQAAAHKANAAAIPNVSSVGWYSKTLANSNFTYINRIGVTQFRLRFATGDNDNLTSDYLRFYSGDAGSANRPALMLTYYDPTP